MFALANDIMDLCKDFSAVKNTNVKGSYAPSEIQWATYIRVDINNYIPRVKEYYGIFWSVLLALLFILRTSPYTN